MYVTDIELKPASVLPIASPSERERDEGWLICPTGQHRDSDLVERCNFVIACEEMERHDPEGVDHAVLRFGHWAVGWVEELVVRPGTACHREAQEIAAALADYPILSDDRHAEMEMEAHAAGECDEYCTHCEYERSWPEYVVAWGPEGTGDSYADERDESMTPEEQALAIDADRACWDPGTEIRYAVVKAPDAGAARFILPDDYETVTAPEFQED